MDKKIIESAVIFIVFGVVCILGNLLSLNKLDRRRAQGTPPIIKSDRLRFHFGLRTMLIAMTLAAVGTALVMYLLR